MKILILTSTILISMISCKKSDSDEIPSCINNKITEMKSAKVTNPPSSVYQYQYEGKTVYYIPPTCCDVPSQLYDKNCNLICSPDGGFSGRGDEKCSDFFDARKNEKLIWKDDRK